MDIHKYVRTINIKRYLVSIPNRQSGLIQQKYQHSGLANASTLNPPGGLAPSLRVFTDIVIRDLESIKNINCKMEKELEEGLDSLYNDKNLVIHPADKGGESLYLIVKIIFRRSIG